jgi:hypothetical protein
MTAHSSRRRKAVLRIEALEDRQLLSASGVAAVTPKAPVQPAATLQPIAVSANPAPDTQTYTASFQDLPTNWQQTTTVTPFNPARGTLTSVDIQITSDMQSQTQVKSLDTQATTIKASAAGTLTLTIPGLAPQVTNLSATDSYNAPASDGQFTLSGPGYHDFGTIDAPGSSSLTLTSPQALAAFTGTNPVSLTALAQASSSVSGSANLLALINSHASATVTVTYHYQLPPSSLSGIVFLDNNGNGVWAGNDLPLPNVAVALTGTDDLGNQVRAVQQTGPDGSYNFDHLRPGNYVITKTTPPGFIDGINLVGSLGGTEPIKDQFFVAIGAGVAGTNYNFSELLPPTVPHLVAPPPPPTTPVSKRMLLGSTVHQLLASLGSPATPQTLVSPTLTTPVVTPVVSPLALYLMAMKRS